ncbi:MAG: hypothetical protein IV100_07375 [Myxococcales bacterium]|nr:hypothetical protein [Myxococcales bacterium]
MRRRLPLSRPALRLALVSVAIACESAGPETAVERCERPADATVIPTTRIEIGLCPWDAPRCRAGDPFSGVWRPTGQAMWLNECPNVDTDFLRSEIVDRYFVILPGKSPGTISTAECLTPDGDHCAVDADFEVVDGVALYPLDRLFDLDEAVGFDCTRRQKDILYTWVCGDLMWSVKEAQMERFGPECESAEAALQAKSGKDVPLDGCRVTFATFAERIRPAAEAQIRSLDRRGPIDPGQTGQRSPKP